MTARALTTGQTLNPAVRRARRNTTPYVTQAYIGKLIARAEKLDLLDVEMLLRAKARSWASPHDPVTVDYVAEALRSRGVPEAQITQLQRVAAPRVAKVKGLTYDEFQRAVGKNVTLGVIPADFAPQMLGWAKALARLPTTSRLLFDREVATIRIDRPRGSESASWDTRGVLRLVVSRDRSVDERAARSHVVHELGHALEEALDVIVTPWSSVYGSPPFVSDYAARNATEDFAETFAWLDLHPRDLKRLASRKYDDMHGRVAEYKSLTSPRSRV